MTVTADPQRERHVELILERVDALPTLSPIATRLLSISSARDANINKIAAMIESDPPLAGKIIGLCRTADKGLGSRITTVKRAVVMLGLDAVRSAVLAVNVYELMSRPATAEDERLARELPDDPEARTAFDRIGFWRHQVGVACAAEAIARRSHRLRVAPEEGFLAGLLHDMGKQALELVMPRAYGKLVRVAERRRSDVAPVERQVLGLDHHTAGKRIAQRWGLPDELSDVIWLHSTPVHTLPELPHRSLIACVTLAKNLCRRLHLGWSGDFGPIADLKTLCVQAGVEMSHVEECAREVHDAAAERFKVLGLEDTSTPELLLSAIGSANAELARLNVELGERAEHAVDQSRVLVAIGDFLNAAPASRGVVRTMEAIAASARAALGASAVATVRTSADAKLPWTATLHPADGTPRDVTIKPGAPAWAALRARQDRSGVPISALPGLAKALGASFDPAQTRVIPLLDHDEGYVLIVSGAADQGDRPALYGALVSAWSSALDAATVVEARARENERVAESSRALAEMQARLTEAESLARLGQVTAGAAHEMNNPLTTISMRAQMVYEAAQDPTVKSSAAAIIKAADDLTDLITTLHILSSPITPNPGRCDASSIVARALELASGRHGAPVEALVSLRGVDNLWTDGELLSIALAECLVNAMEAGAGDKIELSAQVDPVDGRILWEVRDRGSGMSTKALQHAFDAFFSEKPAGRQRGLGLTRARRMVQAIRGDIELSSEPGKGATARITLPPAEEEPHGTP